jgi:hypothetical protein
VPNHFGNLSGSSALQPTTAAPATIDPGGYTTEHFTVSSPVSIDELASFILSAWPPAGVLYTGERETNELEAKFANSSIVGYLLARSDACNAGTTQVSVSYINQGPDNDS